MPLKCLNDHNIIYAFNYNDDAWEALRAANKSTKSLRTACCGTEVTLKTSHLGTKYFAHARKGPCVTAPMTAEHLLAQAHIIEGTQAAGWLPEPEANPPINEITPTGREWQADVLATNGRAKIAFEVQWSKQTPKETLHRQERYRASGVRGLWFFRHLNIETSKELPAFQIYFNEDTRIFKVQLDPLHYMDDELKHAPPIPLQVFVQGCLTGKLIYAPAIGLTFPMEIFTKNKQCKRCLKMTNIVTRLKIRISDKLPGCPNLETDIYRAGIQPYILEWLPAATLRELKIGKLKVRKSFMQVERQASYFSNGCFHCDGIQPEYYEERSLEVEHLVSKVEIEFTEALAKLFSARFVNYWWFNQN